MKVEPVVVSVELAADFDVGFGPFAQVVCAGAGDVTTCPVSQRNAVLNGCGDAGKQKRFLFGHFVQSALLKKLNGAGMGSLDTAVVSLLTVEVGDMAVEYAQDLAVQLVMIGKAVSEPDCKRQDPRPFLGKPHKLNFCSSFSTKPGKQCRCRRPVVALGDGLSF